MLAPAPYPIILLKPAFEEVPGDMVTPALVPAIKLFCNDGVILLI